MKNIILFGIGKVGKKLVDVYCDVSGDFRIVAIADNYSKMKEYQNIPIITVNRINDFQYDEIWISPIHYDEIIQQLIEELHIRRDIIKHVKLPELFIEQQIYKKYKEEILKNKKCKDVELQTLIDYISCNCVRMYNYPFFDLYQQKKFSIFYDSDYELFYGIYEGKRMYLSRHINSAKAAEDYIRFMCMEQDINSPHCYFSGNFRVQGEEIGIDVGAAEGIFSLAVIDKLKHLYLVEADPNWCEALRVTFKPWREKVTIIQKFVSDVIGKEQVTLDSLFLNTKIDFIKMDIEGAEIKALAGAEKIIDKYMPQLAICTYHNALDNQIISRNLAEKGYSIESSKGYVLCVGEWELEHLEDVDFRRALLWAERKSDR